MPVPESSTAAKRSLPVRIQQVEHDIEIRRQLISDRATVLKQDLRQRLVSPAALLTYAGCGLAVGLMLRRPSSRVGSATHTVKAAPGGQTSPGRPERLFANVFKIVAMVRTLASILPAAPAHSSWNSTATSGDHPN